MGYKAGWMTLFLSIVLTIWGVMHLYVFWRLTSAPWVRVSCSMSGTLTGGGFSSGPSENPGTDCPRDVGSLR